MYDTNGNWQKQKVHLGVTKSGQYGLFTGSYLAWPLTEDQYQSLLAHPENGPCFVANLDFEYETRASAIKNER